MKNKEILIYCKELDCLYDLQEWLQSEFIVVNADNDDTAALGDNNSCIKVMLDMLKDNWKHFVCILRNWANNYNKDIELTIQNGTKKMEFKCPSRRISDDQLNTLFSTLNEFIIDE